MSYAIIRNTKYTIGQLNVIYRHNERKNTNYSNKDIIKSNGIYNYSIKKCNTTYSKRFNEIKEKFNLQCRIKRTSNVACEYIITSDKEFFESIGEEETKRYFETAYKFVCNYKSLGEQYIISAKIHNDEKVPHLHLVFVPVVHKLDKKSGKSYDKISCTEFWYGKNSYKALQDSFYKYMTKAGFKLERGESKSNEHIPIEKLKQITNYQVQEIFKNTKYEEKEINSNDIEVIKQDYKRIINKFNNLSKRYKNIQHIVDEIFCKTESIQKENRFLTEYNKTIKQENENLKNEIEELRNYIEKTFECVELLFEFPLNNLKRIVDNFAKNTEDLNKIVTEKIKDIEK